MRHAALRREVRFPSAPSLLHYHLFSYPCTATQPITPEGGNGGTGGTASPFEGMYAVQGYGK